MKIINLIQKSGNNGQTLVEYVILLGLVGIVCLTIVSTFIKVGYRTAFHKYSNLLSGAYIYN